MEEELSFEKDDLLGRKKIAENITRIIDNSDEFNVIAIDSSWGTGKTTFIKKWETMLHNEEYEGKFKTLYFNAWKNDYMKDPFAALLTAINNENSELKESFKTAVSTGIGITKGVTDIFLKLATAGAIGVKEFTDIKDEIFDGIKNEQSTREEFVSEIEQIASGGPKTIFFIDEIDRCRPTFAIELLETIKHLFSAKNIYFIISVDKVQLSHSIRSLYGQEMDADGYLRRFFDLEFNMPIDIKSYIGLKFNTIEKLNKRDNGIYVFRDIFKEIINLHNYSLRDIDKTVDYIKLIIPSLVDDEMIFQSMTRKEMYFLNLILASLIHLKIKEGELYSKIITKNYTNHDVERIIGRMKLSESKGLLKFLKNKWHKDINIDNVIEIYLITARDFNDSISSDNVTIFGTNITILIEDFKCDKRFISILEMLNDFKL